MLNIRDTRLTWLKAFPRPYESLWSILLKVAELNNLSFRDITKLISKDEGANSGSARQLDDPSWIDIDHLAKLLEIDSGRILAGTFAFMRITQQGSAESSRRLCPQCWELGYHSSLFDITAIASCPIHQCALSEPCVGCVSETMFGSRRTAGLLQARRCSRCESKRATRDRLIEIAVTGSEFAGRIGAYAANLLEWWDGIGKAFSERDSILGELMHAGEVEDPQALSGQLYLAQALGGSAPSEWQFRVQPRAAVFAALDILPKQPLDANTESRRPERVRIHEPGAASYRSLRRHLFRTYVHPHKACFHQIARTDREGSMMFDGDKICLPSLAFAVWRMSIEGIIRMDGLSSKRDTNFALRLMRPDEEGDLSFAQQLQWSYFSFFSILENLRRNHGRRKLRIVRPNYYSKGSFTWRKVQSGDEAIQRAGAATVRKFLLLYPQPKLVLESTRSPCRQRKGKERYISDVSLYFIDRTLGSLGSGPRTTPDVLCQICYPYRTGITSSYVSFSV